MKKLITLLSSTAIMATSASSIVACENPFNKDTQLDVNSPDSIGDQIEGSNNFQWLGEIKGDEFNPELAGQLEVNPDHKVIVDNVKALKTVESFKVQNTANGGNLFEAVYDELRSVYGINVVNSVGNYEDFNIFKIEKDGSETFIYNDYNGDTNEVTSGTYLVKALSTSKRISGQFTFELQLISQEDQAL